MKYQVFVVTLIGFISIHAYSESNRRDYDLDNDGLIEIKDLGDLQAIGMSNGQSLYGQNNGCRMTNGYPPSSDCVGFELMRDLDFDTNQNGKFDKGDAYWNGGEGWEPVALSGAAFEGNGFTIRNLTINRPTAGEQGLFKYISSNSYVRNLALTNVSIKASNTSAAITALLDESNISWVFVTGEVIGTNESYALGGVAGYVTHSHISNAFTNVAVNAHRSSGAVIGRVGESSSLSYVLAVGKVSLSVGDSVGFGDGSPGNFYNNHFATDVSDLPYDKVSDANGSAGALLSELKCSVTYDGCVSGSRGLYPDWTMQLESIAENNNNYWYFIDQQLPGLMLNLKLHRVDVGNSSSSSKK
jgi:hypothetical protein